MTAEEILNRYAAGNRKSSIDLRDCDFSGQNLFQLGISVDLRGANFERAILDAAELNGVNLNGANFFKAQCESIRLVGASLGTCFMQQIEMQEAFLTRASFFGADMREGFFDGARFEYADLTKANLTSADLTRCRFRGAKFQETDFTNAILDEANFASTDLRGAIGLNLKGAVLRNTIMPDGALIRELTEFS